MKRFWKYTNFKWLAPLLAVSGIYILCTIEFDTSILPKRLTAALNEINISFFSSLVLLVMIEIFIFLRDKKQLGYLAGEYNRSYITEINENGVRSSTINSSQRAEEERRSTIKFLEEYKYHELSYYACHSIEWLIVLDYGISGNYTGTAEYYNHNSSSATAPNERKALVDINLSLNSSDRTTGAGSYKYQIGQDYGIYTFQVIDRLKGRILVYYQNIHPSGLAEGYEIWERKR